MEEEEEEEAAAAVEEEEESWADEEQETTEEEEAAATCVWEGEVAADVWEEEEEEAAIMDLGLGRERSDGGERRDPKNSLGWRGKKNKGIENILISLLFVG